MRYFDIWASKIKSRVPIRKSARIRFFKIAFLNCIILTKIFSIRRMFVTGSNTNISTREKAQRVLNACATCEKSQTFKTINNCWFHTNYTFFFCSVFLRSGLIGQSWAMIFASVGYKVSIYDIVDSQVENALKQAEAQLKSLEERGLLRGTLTAEQQFSCISGKSNQIFPC